MEKLVFSIGLGFVLVGCFCLLLMSFGNFIDKKLKRPSNVDDEKAILNIAMFTVMIGAALIVGSIASYYGFIVNMLFH